MATKDDDRLSSRRPSGGDIEKISPPIQSEKTPADAVQSKSTPETKANKGSFKDYLVSNVVCSSEAFTNVFKLLLANLQIR